MTDPKLFAGLLMRRRRKGLPTGAIRYRIHHEDPYKGVDFDYVALDLDAAAAQVEELTGEDAEQVIESIGGDGFPWGWEDPETGRTVTLQVES